MINCCRFSCFNFRFIFFLLKRVVLSILFMRIESCFSLFFDIFKYFLVCFGFCKVLKLFKVLIVIFIVVIGVFSLWVMLLIKLFLRVVKCCCFFMFWKIKMKERVVRKVRSRDKRIFGVIFCNRYYLVFVNFVKYSCFFGKLVMIFEVESIVGLVVFFFFGFIWLMVKLILILDVNNFVLYLIVSKFMERELFLICNKLWLMVFCKVKESSIFLKKLGIFFG